MIPIAECIDMLHGATSLGQGDSGLFRRSTSI